jgi:hypothetical protein
MSVTVRVSTTFVFEPTCSLRVYVKLYGGVPVNETLNAAGSSPARNLIVS